jgi:competence protein ComGC
MNAKQTLQQGFTLIEMLVIAPIVVLAIGAFLTVIISMTGEVLSSRGANTLAYSVQDALNRIDQDVKLSTTFLATNNITLTAGEAQGYNNDATNFTNVGGTSGTSLILNSLATNDNPTVLTSGLVYLTNKPNSCASNRVQDNTPMAINIVYFVKDNTLWRRTIMPSNYAVGTSVYCTTPWQQPSCAPGYTAVFCKTNDIKLVEGVSSSGFSVQYFTSASATSADVTASDTAALVTARGTALQSLPAVGVSITASQSIAGRTVERSASLRSTRLDTNASTIAAVTPDTIPSAPSGLATTYTAPGSITVSWHPNATSYNLQYSTNSSFSSPTQINSITNTSQLVSGLSPSTSRYYFRVQAVNSAGTSAWSSYVSEWITISNGLTAWWKLNGNGTATIGSTNITITGATTAIGQNGTASNAYAFNGTAAQYGTFVSTLGLGTTNVTLSAWVNPAVATNSGLFIKVGTSNGYGIGMGSTTFDNATPGTKIIMLYEGVRWIVTTTNITTGWHHVVMVIDSAGVPSAYMDGALVGTYSGTGAIAPTGTTYIGGGYTSARNFNGRIDDVRIYTRALSLTEIQTLNSGGGH